MSPDAPLARGSSRRRGAAPAAALALLALLSLATPARAEPFRFVKGPYQQGLTTGAAVIRWEGSERVGGSLRVTGPDGFVAEVKTEEPTAFHSLQVSGMKPATAYGYVVTAGGVESPEGKLVTAPGEPRPFSFLVYGDNRSDEAAHRAVVAAMRRVPSDFLLHTGDMVSEGSNERAWASFFSVEEPLLRDRCLFACVGNHELVGGEPWRFLRYFHPGAAAPGEPSLFYSVRWSNARFLFLNAFASFGGSSDERRWLEQELTREDAEPGIDHRFLLLHQGPFSGSAHGGNEAFATRDMLALLRAHRVTLLFTGHDHMYERGEQAGVRYIMTGGGGAPLYKPRKDPGSAPRSQEVSYHFVEVKVDGKAVTTVAHRVDGSLMETCSVTLEGFACDGGLPPVKRPTPSAGPPEGAGRGRCDCGAPGRSGGGGGALSSSPGWLVVACGLFRRLLRARKLS